MSMGTDELEEVDAVPIQPLQAYRLAASDAAVLETFVVPRYLVHFGELLLENLIEADHAQVAHVGCRTGYPDRGIAMKLEGSHIYGVDASPAALELARAKAATLREMRAEYIFAEEFPLPFPDAAFSHVLSIHPVFDPESRAMLIAEMKRILAPSGQLLLAMPLRGSFSEVADLLRECALKRDDAPLNLAVERAMGKRPTVEGLAAELEELGLDSVDVSLRPLSIPFPNGRAFVEDPITRLMLVPEFHRNLSMQDLTGPLDYVREAIDKYWSDGSFELSVNVGCVVARQPG
ncbi:hypothetical protein BH09MYX1_BH09MYX1_32860 [soil metagenome]